MKKVIETRHGEAVPIYLIQDRNGQIELILELIHQ